MRAQQYKSGSAAIGLGAVVAMAALGVVFGYAGAAEPAGQVASPVVVPQASGQTITTTTPPASPETSVATPSVTATTPSGFAPAPHP